MAVQFSASRAALAAVLCGMASTQRTSTEVGGECEFDTAPAGVGSFWDPTCVDGVNGGLGCNGDGKHMECRLCGGGDFLSVPCPPSSCDFPQQPYIPFYWDSSCELGQLGCLADGVHTQCRFCGDFPFSAVPCPEGAAAPPMASCAFDNSEPDIPTYWEPGCFLGMHGCNADGQHVQCRHCGKGEYSHIHCPGSQVCSFGNIPTVPYYYDPSCHAGLLGCKADGVHDECRYCGEAPFEAVPCPQPHEGVHLCRSTLGHRPVNYYWDESCEVGQLGCLADGIHKQCRFCGSEEFESITCPDVHSNNLDGSATDSDPTEAPTMAPTEAPTVAQTAATMAVTVAPTAAPTAAPTEVQTVAPTEAQTAAPTAASTMAPAPTAAPTMAPTVAQDMGVEALAAVAHSNNLRGSGSQTEDVDFEGLALLFSENVSLLAEAATEAAGGCSGKYMKAIRGLAPGCLGQCKSQRICEAFSRAIFAFGGKRKNKRAAKRSVCRDKDAFACLLQKNHRAKCRPLYGPASNFGIPITIGGLNGQCR